MLVADGHVLGYFVAMKGVDEVHLLNITVAPGVPGPGLVPRHAGCADPVGAGPGVPSGCGWRCA